MATTNMPVVGTFAGLTVHCEHRGKEVVSERGTKVLPHTLPNIPPLCILLPKEKKAQQVRNPFEENAN